MFVLGRKGMLAVGPLIIGLLLLATLAFGVLFATTVTLLFVPCLYMTGARLKQKITGYTSDSNTMLN
jgi:hypothetical protein